MPELSSRLAEIFIYRINGDAPEYLLLKRSGKVTYSGIWSVCAGKIEPGEKAYEAAVREMREETGLAPEELYNVDAVNVFYDPVTDGMHVVPVFLARVEICDVTLNEEHTEYKWLTADEAVKTLHWVSHKNNLKLIRKCLTHEEYFRTLNLILKK
ncbi:MAG: NUDIX domain-containing protein [Ignavibacteria bacterium]|nr:NUDIX domain-containing protein [Ignavibacteria bacterium]